MSHTLYSIRSCFYFRPSTLYGFFYVQNVFRRHWNWKRWRIKICRLSMKTYVIRWASWTDCFKFSLFQLNCRRHDSLMVSSIWIMANPINTWQFEHFYVAEKTLKQVLFNYDRNVLGRRLCVYSGRWSRLEVQLDFRVKHRNVHWRI